MFDVQLNASNDFSGGISNMHYHVTLDVFSIELQRKITSAWIRVGDETDFL